MGEGGSDGDRDEPLLSPAERPKKKEKGIIYTYQDLSFWRVLFSWKGTIFPGTWKETLLVVFIAGLITAAWKISHIDHTIFVLDLDGHKLTIAPIGFLLVLRTNLAYSRYWEGRSLIGGLVYNAREIIGKSKAFIVDGDTCNLEVKSAVTTSGRQVMVIGQKGNLSPESLAARMYLLRLLSAVVVLARQHLCKQPNLGEIKDSMTEEEMAYLERHPTNQPLVVLNWMREALIGIESENKILNESCLRSMDRNISGLLLSWMGMAKIVSTPFPFPYAHMLRLFLYVWVFTLPLALIGKMGVLTPAVSMFVAFALFGINKVGEELEDPFGEDTNDFDLIAFEDGILKEIEFARTTAS